MSLSELADAITAHMAEWKLGSWTGVGEVGERFVVSAVVSRWNAEYTLDDEEAG